MKRLKMIGVCMVLIAAVAFTIPSEKYFDIAKSLDIFTTLFKEVNTYYVDDVDPKKLIETGINGMLNQLDPYTDYIPEEDLETFSIQTTGQYAGVGALIGIINKKTVITNPYIGFPAHRGGLRVGDEIISVNGQNVQGKPTSNVSALLKGKPNTEVVMEVKRLGVKEPISFKLIREKIKISNITYHEMIDKEVGYIKLDEFTPGAAKEVGTAVTEFKKLGAKKVILDLRDNLGGSLYEAVNIVNLFIPKGKEVVSTKGKVEDWNKSYKALNNPLDTEIPLVVLISSSSASASEIVAGSLQDYDRAVLIGQKTFGKGLVQTTRQLAYNAQLKVTTAKYYIPSGRCIQAIDYEHRKSDGTVSKFPDSLKREFKTQGGRKVYDGAGLDPDVSVEVTTYSSVVIELVNSGLVFDYATKYCSENPNQASMKNFRLTDQEYQKFVTWVAEQKFTYATELDQKADELITSAKREKYYNELQPQFNELKAHIDQNKNTALIRNKPELTHILEQEIAFHYQLTKGQIEVMLDRDPELTQARKVFADAESYRKIL
ncbi:MAG TPA: S41 family peptidase, partial [Cyclobacteriaceae bacterium]|nr:S41 family peptidase [Cyclobacteriaceae bacterium]